MKNRMLQYLLVVLVIGSGRANANTSQVNDLIPPLAHIKREHPRVLLRPRTCPWAISVTELSDRQRDVADDQMLAQLRNEKSVSAQAMVWLLTGESAAGDRAIATLRAYHFPENADTFHVFFTLIQYALAYDWLYNYAGFTPAMKNEVRANVLPLAARGLQFADDHVFHNYIWMSAGGVALWALATAGEDATSDRLFEQVRQRFNTGLFPAWKYLDGLPSEPMGYWALYVLTPGVLTLLAAQSAFETNLVGIIRETDGAWLDRHFENLIHSTLPDMRYVPWGDLQSGPNGGVTLDMAGIIDALTWATQSPQGAFLGNWLAKKRGQRRFRAETAVFYFLYTQHLQVPPAPPPLSFVAGNRKSGHFISRSGWNDGETIVTLSVTDHFGDHHHYDQGSFIIYRNGLLAVDPPVYQKIRGPQQPTSVHNTLLFDGQGQRPARGQWFKTIEDFQRNLTAGRQLETGNLLFWKDAGTWSAAAGQFAQAYWPTQVQSCVRQLLHVRPNWIVIVDQLGAPTNQSLPDIQWLLQLPTPPTMEGSSFWASNGKSWLRCRPLGSPAMAPTVEATPVHTQRVSLHYRGDQRLILAHLIEVGDGPQPGPTTDATIHVSTNGIEISLGKSKFMFASQPPFTVIPLE